MADSATANAGLCSGRGYNTCVSQMAVAKNVSWLPSTETD